MNAPKTGHRAVQAVSAWKTRANRVTKGANMGSKLTVWLCVSCAVAALAGCEDGAGLGSARPETAATAAADRPAATRLVERDVEAPDVFQQTEAGLWDGRPSLGGVWVAHPDVTDPERVMVRNAANGETVIGALFRRERTQPGPRFQVSSDAAAALGMLAGAPVELTVTALRREEAPAEAPEAGEAQAGEAEAVEAEAVAGAGADASGPQQSRRGAEATPAALAAAEPVETEALDPIASASAAIERAEADGAGGASAAGDTAMADAAPADAQAGEAQPAAGDGRRRRSGGLFAGLFRPRGSEPLSAISGASAAGAEAGTVVEASAPAAPTRSAGAPRESFVQIGIFSVEDNAQSTAALMRRNNVNATVYEQESAGKTFWRVVVGPADSRADRAALLRKVKGFGFSDAYAVTR